MSPKTFEYYRNTGFNSEVHSNTVNKGRAWTTETWTTSSTPAGLYAHILVHKAVHYGTADYSWSGYVTHTILELKISRFLVLVNFRIFE